MCAEMVFKLAISMPMLPCYSVTWTRVCTYLHRILLGQYTWVSKKVFRYNDKSYKNHQLWCNLWHYYV